MLTGQETGEDNSICGSGRLLLLPNWREVDGHALAQLGSFDVESGKVSLDFEP